MKKLSICLVSLTIAPDSQDGSAKFFKGIFEYLKTQGHNVKVITGKWNKDLDDLNIHQVKLIRKSYLWMPQFYFVVLKFLKRHRFDIIHGNGPKGSLPLLSSDKKRFISTIHDLGPLETKFSLLPFEKYLIKRTIKKAKYITTCSDSIKNEIKHYFPFVNLENIYNLYSAIEDKYKPYPREAEKLKKRLNLEGPILLYIGRVTAYKGVDDIINAYKIVKKEIPELNLIIGGKPDFNMKKIYEEWVRDYKDILFVGFISEKELPYYYTMADLFVTYSHASEGFGLTPIESIACGTPVICSSLIAYKEVLEDNAIFVPPKKPHLLAEEIKALISDEPKRNKMVKKAQEFIKKYTWNAVGEKLERVYEHFLKA